MMMTGAEIVLGLFATVSSGWGFSPGWGAETGVETRHLRCMVAATTEAKQDSGYTYAASCAGFVVHGRLATGGGLIHYGYADGWSRAATSGVVAVEYRADWGVLGLDYVFQHEESPAVATLRVRSPLAGRLWLTASLQQAISFPATAGTLGLQWRI